jgi:hypothetical protein
VAGEVSPAPGEHGGEVLADWGVPDVDGWLAGGAVQAPQR